MPASADPSPRQLTLIGRPGDAPALSLTTQGRSGSQQAEAEPDSGTEALRALAQTHQTWERDQGRGTASADRPGKPMSP